MSEDITYPHAVTAWHGECTFCALVNRHPDRKDGEPMYWAVFSPRSSDKSVVCQQHAIDLDLITDGVIIAKPGAEATALLHLRGEEHRTVKCPFPHDEGVSHHETAEESFGPVVVTVYASEPGQEYTLVLPDGRVATIGEPQGAYSELADIIDEAFPTPSHRETAPLRPDSWVKRRREAATFMAPDEVLVIEHLRNRHQPHEFTDICRLCDLQQRLDSIIEGD